MSRLLDETHFFNSEVTHDLMALSPAAMSLSPTAWSMN